MRSSIKLELFANINSPIEKAGEPGDGSSHKMPLQGGRGKWVLAFRRVFPLYFAFNVGCIVMSVLALMVSQSTNDLRHFSLSLLWRSWNHWDTGHYIDIALHGYAIKESTAFFPLYPLLIRGVTYLTLSPLIAGLLLANIAMLITFMVFYQLVYEDFGPERADRAILYMAVFPTALFLAAAYNMSLSISLALLCFYNIRRGNWWLAGIFGLFASLTRSAGLFLAFPFLYEYLRQHQFRLRNFRFDMASIVLIPAGVALFALYCYYRFGDFLAFSHVEVMWDRRPEPLWYGIVQTIYYIRASPGILSFQSLHNLLNLVPDVLFLIFGVLSFVGPWRFPRSHWSYVIYAIIFWCFINLVPVSGSFPYPLSSAMRYLCESFPTFIFLAAWGKSRLFHMTYICFCGPIFVYLLIQHLLGLPVV